MNEMVMVVPVIAFTIAVGAGILWIFKGYLKQREMISAVKEEVESAEQEDFLQAA